MLVGEPGAELAHIDGRFRGAPGARAAHFWRMACERWIAVGTDFSDGAREALERALSLAQDSRAKVALVHVYEDELGANAPADPTSRLLGQLAQEIAVSGATRRGSHVEPLVRRGPPWEKILNVATEYGAEVIVVGRSGQRGATRSSEITPSLELTAPGSEAASDHQTFMPRRSDRSPRPRPPRERRPTQLRGPCSHRCR
jgi:nucleotide-binding universal stress UspA family protein